MREPKHYGVTAKQYRDQIGVAMVAQGKSEREAAEIIHDQWQRSELVVASWRAGRPAHLTAAEILQYPFSVEKRTANPYARLSNPWGRG